MVSIVQWHFFDIQVQYLLDKLLVVLRLRSRGLQVSLSSDRTLSETIAQVSA